MDRSEPTVGFGSFYRREFPRMVALAASLCGGRDLGAELAQEALLRAYRDWVKVSTLDRPGTWVRRVTVNLAIDAHRRLVSEQAALAKVGTHESVSDGYGVDDRFWVLVLLSAVESALPAAWTSVTVEACRDRFVQFVAIADQSSCPTDVTECRENQPVWMAYVDGKWLLLDAGTGIGCGVEGDVAPTLEKACEALFPSGVDGEVLRYPYPSTDEVGMAAQIKGVLELDGACLYIKIAEAGERYPILWPAGTTWQGEGASVIPPGGEPIPVGAEVIGAGGFLNVSSIETLADSDAYQRALECVDNTYDEIAVVNNQPDAIARAVSLG